MTPLSRLRELAARSTQIKELATKEKESPTVAPVTRGAIKGAATGAGLAGLAGAGLGAAGIIAGSKLAPRQLLKANGVRGVRSFLKSHGAPANTAALSGVAALGTGVEASKYGAAVGGIGGAFQGARIKGRDEERFKNKEFGLLTKNEAAYDKSGHFTGVENHYNGPGIAEAAGGAALAGAGLGAGHVGIMKKYGTETLRREKGRFISPKEVKVPTGQAYRKAGSDALAKIRALSGKRFSAKARLKELAAGPVAHAVFGTANVGAYNAPWGKKSKAYKDGYLHDTKYILGGGAIGGSAGAGIGALVGKKGDRAIPVLVGGLGGALAGETAGYIKGIRHPKAKETRDRHLSAKDRLKELAEKSASLKSFDDKVDENGHPIRDAAVGAGLGAGAVLGHQAVMKKYGQDGAGIGQAYGAAASDFKGGFNSSFNPPSTSAGSGSVATAATNSPLSADTAKLGGVAKAGEEASVLSRAGSKVGGLGAAIRGFLSRMR